MRYLRDTFTQSLLYRKPNNGVNKTIGYINYVY